MNLIWLGHSAFRVELGAAVILIDPFLSGNPKFTGDAAKAAAGASHILLTHGHDDHIGDAANIAKTTGAQVISNFEICMYLNAQGAENINPGNTGGAIDCGHGHAAPSGHPGQCLFEAATRGEDQYGETQPRRPPFWRGRCASGRRTRRIP